LWHICKVALHQGAIYREAIALDSRGSNIMVVPHILRQVWGCIEASVRWVQHMHCMLPRCRQGLAQLQQLLVLGVKLQCCPQILDASQHQVSHHRQVGRSKGLARLMQHLSILQQCFPHDTMVALCGHR
jgi:hypothetical protein